MDLSHLSTMDLRALSQRVSKQIQTREEEERKRALDEIAVIARNIGMPLNDLMNKLNEAPLKPKSPRYANPGNRDETWTGFGRQPRWLKAHLANGNSLESALI